ncbi:MAG: DivIVA domain-containing protein [Candidatus Ancillula trichonymphae]|jgi:DivIVA domain-containing protein|nr:DivIVA domain-containing protein [Candidatus Ancillula trichonymphae]
MELLFTRTRFGIGYDTSQVDAFFAHSQAVWNNPVKALTEREVRFVRFDLVRKGYSVFEVDDALWHVERALAKRTKQEIVQAVAKSGWVELMTSNAKELYAVLITPKKSKFEIRADAQVAYEQKSVDKYLKVIYEQFFEKRKKLTATAVKKKSFPQVKASRGYSTQQVDEFLDKVMILNAFEV